ncbi:MAG: class I SAM-dependent methyltransferase [Anaerolineae bacterium]|nr:class I SAM-dependent methyltransferase [Anaerolineae bacterium]
MANHQAEVYANQADQYEALVSREDYEGNILTALQEITSFEGLDVIDTGAGTGRLACILAPFAKSIRAFDVSAHMLEVAAARLEAMGLHNWKTDVGNHRALPVADASADVIVTGWSLAYTVVWEEDKGLGTYVELEKALAEFDRVLRPGGLLLVLETLGTGHATPQRYPGMKGYLDYLDTHGFSSTWIRTDFKFASEEEARDLITFFFERDMNDALISRDPCILPECTGIWWRRKRI